MLWRDAEWRCEYAPNISGSPGGIVSLYMHAALVAEHEAHGVDEVMRVSSFWRELVLGPGDSAGSHEVRLVPTRDRRQGPPDRRLLARGGRRVRDVHPV